MSEPFFVGPLLSIAADCSGGSGPCVLTGTQASPWSARADENVVRVGSVAWTGVRRQQSGLWPPAQLSTNTYNMRQPRAATLLLISLPRIT